MQKNVWSAKYIHLAKTGVLDILLTRLIIILNDDVDLLFAL